MIISHCDNFKWTAKGLSHTYTCIHSPPNSPPIQAATKHWSELPVLYGRSLLIIIVYLFIYFLTALHGLRDLNSLTKDRTQTLSNENTDCRGIPQSNNIWNGPGVSFPPGEPYLGRWLWDAVYSFFLMSAAWFYGVLFTLWTLGRIPTMSRPTAQSYSAVLYQLHKERNPCSYFLLLCYFWGASSWIAPSIMLQDGLLPLHPHSIKSKITGSCMCHCSSHAII